APRGSTASAAPAGRPLARERKGRAVTITRTGHYLSSREEGKGRPHRPAGGETVKNVDVIRAWKDEAYRASLSAAERAALPPNPGGGAGAEGARPGGRAGRKGGARPKAPRAGQPRPRRVRRPPSRPRARPAHPSHPAPPAPLTARGTARPCHNRRPPSNEKV